VNTSRPMVLIVDDEPDMCWVLENLLARSDFDFRIAQTGQAALELMESIMFTIALLDVKLTDMDGLDLAKRLKSMNALVRIAMISGYYYKDDVNIRRAMDEGLVSGFIAKPFLNEEVIGILQTLASSESQP
jgi:DNA-binding NtrC family response regulator